MNITMKINDYTLAISFNIELKKWGISLAVFLDECKDGWA